VYGCAPTLALSERKRGIEMTRSLRAAAALIVLGAGLVALAASGSSAKSGGTKTTSAPIQTTAPTAAAAPTTAPTARAAPTTTKATAPPATSPTRQVTGTATTLGAGTFTGGKDAAAGLYDVTPGAGQSGNFIVNGTDSYNEVLGANGVVKVRVKISSGDSIEISGLSQVTFTLVTTPLVTTHSQVTLYAGTWTAGEDIGPGRYVATPGAGQSGNFIVEAENVNEILGSNGVPSVTFDVKNGDVISISSLGQVTMTPA
jgi:hypothetical protein